MERVAIFPGSFDPFTIGHESIVKRAIPLFDKIVIMIGFNSNKKLLIVIQIRLILHLSPVNILTLSYHRTAHKTINLHDPSP